MTQKQTWQFSHACMFFRVQLHGRRYYGIFHSDQRRSLQAPSWRLVSRWHHRSSHWIYHFGIWRQVRHKATALLWLHWFDLLIWNILQYLWGKFQAGLRCWVSKLAQTLCKGWNFCTVPHFPVRPCVCVRRLLKDMVPRVRQTRNYERFEWETCVSSRRASWHAHTPTHLAASCPPPSSLCLSYTLKHTFHPHMQHMETLHAYVLMHMNTYTHAVNTVHSAFTHSDIRKHTNTDV